MYFSDVDGEFAKVECDSVSYCSNLFVLNPSCQVGSNGNCTVVDFPTIPVLIYLTFAQTLSFFLKYYTVAEAGLASLDSKGQKRAPTAVRAVTLAYTFVVFVLQAFALPFGTKEGVIAFSPMRDTGLQVTAIVAFFSTSSTRP